jgi:hypothetical protein
MFEYRLEHIMSYTATLAAPEIIGPLAEGVRVNFYVTGGEVTGPKISGKILPVGGDWLTIRRDGVGLLDVRATLQTHDGALIYTAYNGTLDLGEDGYEKFLQGNPPPSGTPLYISPRLYSAHPDYAWVNRLHCLGIGKAFVERAEVAYDVYAVR